MGLSRREFMQMLAAAALAGLGFRARAGVGREDAFYDVPVFGNVSLLHITDVHAQLKPIHFRETNVNIGVGDAWGRPPHLVGQVALDRYGLARGSREAHAFTHFDFEEGARRFGKVGGFAHLATLLRRLRADRPNRSLLLDGGDTWQGSATSLWTRAQDMVDAGKLLNVDAMTGHWEFTHGARRVQEILENDLKGHIEFLAQNVNDATWGELIFKPYTLRELNGVPVAVIGQAFPYTPIANPRWMFPEWSFGIKDDHLQKMVDEVRGKGAQIVALLSHNGADVDIKLAGRVTGIDVVFGGHTHDVMPVPLEVKNRGGRTLVINSGHNGKFLSLLDLDVRNGRMRDYRYRLLPVFANLLPPDSAMQAHIERIEAPYREKLDEKLAVTESVLYRRSNFIGSSDQLVLDALMQVMGAEIAFSPGFRWGATLLPGDAITFGQVVDLTAITYPTVTLNTFTGAQIKSILEDVADNLFNTDPYLQTGGDMARVGGMRFSIDPTQTIGKRIADMELRGKPLSPTRKYKVAGWASIQENPPGTRPIWDVVAEYLRHVKRVRIERLNAPRIKGVAGNPGIAPD